MHCRSPASLRASAPASSAVLALTGTFAQLTDYVAFGDWILFGLTVASLLRYRARDRALPVTTSRDSFRAPGYPWTPALFVAAAGHVVVSSVLASPRNALIGTALLGLGLPVYGYWRRRARTAQPAAARSTVP